MSARYTIRRVVADDLPLLTQWRTRPHVMRWWGDPGMEPEAEKLAEPRVRMWIAELDGRPFAFIQDYRVDDWPPHHFGFLPAGARGIDLYIGEPDLIGQGHGTALLRQFGDAQLGGREASALGIDPHPDNAPAIRAFAKAGFSVVGEPVDTRWGRAVLMTRLA